MRKRRPERPVTPREIETKQIIPHIGCLISQPFRVTPNTRYAPLWEKEFLLKEPYSTFLNPEVLMLVEILNHTKNSTVGKDGWYKVAWAFLLLVSSNKRANTEKKVKSTIDSDPRGAIAIVQISQEDPKISHVRIGW